MEKAIVKKGEKEERVKKRKKLYGRTDKMSERKEGVELPTSLIIRAMYRKG